MCRGGVTLKVTRRSTQGQPISNSAHAGYYRFAEEFHPIHRVSLLINALIPRRESPKALHVFHLLPSDSDGFPRPGPLEHGYQHWPDAEPSSGSIRPLNSRMPSIDLKRRDQVAVHNWCLHTTTLELTNDWREGFIPPSPTSPARSRAYCPHLGLTTRVFPGEGHRLWFGKDLSRLLPVHTGEALVQD
jgi:hypothetical protein